jgi:hypothetical protein
MGAYVLVESRDPWTFREVPETWELAKRLKQAGDQVTVFLVENGVLAARAGRFSGDLESLSKSGVTVVADDFSLRERGITQPKGVAPVPLDTLVDHLVEGSKVLWQ